MDVIENYKVLHKITSRANDAVGLYLFGYVIGVIPWFAKSLLSGFTSRPLTEIVVEYTFLICVAIYLSISAYANRKV